MIPGAAAPPVGTRARPKGCHNSRASRFKVLPGLKFDARLAFHRLVPQERAGLEGGAVLLVRRS